MCDGNDDWGDCPCQDEPDVGFTIESANEARRKAYRERVKPKPVKKSNTPMSDNLNSDFWDDYI